MSKADLHVHSKYSEHPSEWFLKRLGAAESYTDPFHVYRMAKEKGMNWVTITDHNRIEGALLLNEKYPKETFLGVEATAYFPEDDCKIHVLCYGFSAEQFEVMDRLRNDVYQFRDYLVQENIVHSLAHATYAVNNKLQYHHLERLILLFNIFESINGGRNRMNNLRWTYALSKLTPEHIEDYRRRYHIEPVGDTPWIKGFTGGSDDHAGIFIADTYTEAEGKTPQEFLQSIANRQGKAHGRHNDFQSLVFSVYKIAYDFTKEKGKEFSGAPLLSQLTEAIFEKKSFSKTNLLKIKGLKAINGKRKQKRRIQDLLFDLIEKANEEKPIQQKLKDTFETIAETSDELLKLLLQSVESDLIKGDVDHLIKNLTTALPGVFLSVPFFTSFRHMYKGRELLNELQKRFGNGSAHKRILWFTDTLNDLNGVSVTLHTIGKLSMMRDQEIKIVTSVDANALMPSPYIIHLPSIYSYNLPYYESYVLRIPSLLRSLDIIYRYEPDEIYLSTPGPMGLIGLFIARLMSIPCIGIYHTDFRAQAKEIVKDDGVVKLLDSYVQWFYKMVDTIRVPTQEYMNILEQRGFDRTRMKLFTRGVDTHHFSRQNVDKSYLQERFAVPKEGIHFLYAGRISKDKNLEFLFQVFENVQKAIPNARLLLAGTGPNVAEFETLSTQMKHIHFIGKVAQTELPKLYSAVDFLVFPSNTDTFGMVVVEALSCGVPVFVSNIGGPKELVEGTRAGVVLPANHLQAWTDAIVQTVLKCQQYPENYLLMQTEARKIALERSNWDKIFHELTAFEEPKWLLDARL
ncbi:MAG: glycosyltransferase [bacterium]|nr:glycosyltransferase [bacterium]